MAKRPLLLTARQKERRLAQEVTAFFEMLSLQLQVGLDLGFSWPATLEALEKELSDEGRLALAPGVDETVQALLARLSRDFPLRPYRLWFGVLRELYEQGAPLGEAIQNLSGVLRAEQLRGWEAHCRALPGRSNLVLLLFFFPATLLLLFGPLLLGILAGFAL